MSRPRRDRARPDVTPEPDHRLESLAARAVAGDELALDTFLRAVRDDVYRLALRMLGHPFDAEDAAQEILVRVVTNLASFRGESSIRTWIWRVAANHLLGVRRSRREPPGADFETLEGMLASGLASPVGTGTVDGPDQVERTLLEDEIRLGCTSMMLTSLDRAHRLAFILAEVLDLPSDVGAEVLGIAPAAFRKRVSRARRRLRAFMTAACGLVNEGAACRCARQVEPSMRAGLLDPDRMLLATHARAAAGDQEVLAEHRRIETAERWLAVLRDHPRYAAPELLTGRIRSMVGLGEQDS